MKESIKKISLGIFALAFSISAYAQCPAITCPSDVVTVNDSSNCGATVTFSPSGIDTCASSNQQTFVYTGAQESFVVPAGVTTITVDAYGAQGGANWANNINYGGYVQADITVIPGSTIYIYVGEQPTGLTGGWNGGGDGETGGIGGGGSSDIRIGGVTMNDRMIVAGSGGGAGYWSSQHVYGGLGGGLIGGDGYRDTPTTEGGDGGTQVASGDGTCASLNNPICAGGFGYGGAPSGCGCEGYGGGSGWWGGAGSGNCRGGGGGSSYTDPAATNVTHTQAIRQGHGEITLSWGGGAGGTMTQIAGLSSGSSFPMGMTTNTFVYESAGQSDTCSFTVTVNPSIPVNLAAFASDSICVYDAPISLPIASPVGGSYSGPGVSGINFDPSFSGTGSFWIIYTYIDSVGCAQTDSSQITVTGCLGVDDISTLSGVKIYPNPTNDLINIDLSDHIGSVNYSITSIEGKIVEEANNVIGSEITVDFSKELNGIYLLRIEDGSAVRLIKIVKR